MSGDITASNRLFIANDTSLNGNVYVGKNINIEGHLAIKTYSASATLYTVGYQFVEMSDVSLSGRLYAMNDVSLNRRLFMGSDVSFNNRLFITGDLSAGGNIIGESITAPIMNIATDINMSSFSNPVMQQFGTITNAIIPTPAVPLSNYVNLTKYAQYSASKNSIALNNLYLRSDVSLNANVFISSDVSMISRLFIGSSTSFNSRLFIGSDASFGSRLFIPADVSLNRNLYVNNDVSLNRRLFVNMDLSVNGNILINSFKSNTLNTLNSWKPISGLSTNATWSSTSCSSTGQYMVATCVNDSVYLSSNYGAGGSWSSITSLPVNSVNWTSSCVSATGQYIFITSNGGGCYLSSGYGTNNTWSQIPTSILPTTANFIHSAMSSNGQYILTLDNNSGSVYISVGYGISDSWGPIPSTILPTNSAWSGVAMSSTGQYMAVSIIGGSLYLSSNYGQSWTAVSIIPSLSWQNISMSANGQYIIIGNNSAGSLYLSNNFGNTWTVPAGTPTNSNWSDVTISNSGQYMTACNNTTGYIYYSSDYGITWRTFTNIITSNSWINISISSTGLYVIASISGGAVYMNSMINSANITSQVGISNLIPQYTLDVSGQLNTNQGLVTTGITPSTVVYQQNWAPVPALPTQAIDWNSVAMSSTGQYILVGYNSAGYGLWLSTNYGSNWSQITNAHTNGNYRGMAVSSTGQYMIAATNETVGKIYFSDSYGTNLSWKQLNLSGTNGLPTATNSGWIGAAISSTGQYMLLALYSNPGNMYLSTNFGVSWSLITGVPTSTTNYFVPSISATGQYMLITNYINGSYISNNYGSTWTLLGRTNGLNQTANVGHVNSNMSDNGQYMAIAGNFSNTIFVSNNYGVTWSPSLSTKDMNSVCVSATGQYMIASCTNERGSGVYSSTDYGVTWSKSTKLPTTTQTFMIAMSKDTKYILVSKNITGHPLYLSVGTPITTMGLNNPTPQYTLDIANNRNTQQLDTYATAPTNFAGSYAPIMDLGTAYTWTSAMMSPTGQYMIVTTSAGGVWISTTYGATWSQTTLSTSLTWNYSAISSTGQYMTVGSTTGFFLSLDYGNTWTIISCISTSVNYCGLSMSSTGQYMLASVNGTTGVFLSSNYGANSVAPYGSPGWTLTTLSTSHSYLSTAMSSDGQYMLTGQNNPTGSLFLSINFGVTWSQRTVGVLTNVAWYQVGMSSTGQFMIAAATGGFVYVSSNYGVNWTQTSLATASTSTQQPCSVSGTGQYMFVGNNNGAFYSVDYGVTWTKNSYLPTSTVWRFGSISSTGQYSLQIIQSSNVYLSQGSAVNSSNQIANFGANASWSNLSSVFSNPLITTCAISGTGQYMLIGTWGSIGAYLSTNYGYSFTQISTASVPTAYWYYCAAISSTGQYMILGNSNGTSVGSIYLSTNFGSTFSSITMPASDSWQHAAISSTGQYMVIVTTTSNRVYLSNNYGASGSWTAVATTSVPTTASFYGVSMSANGQYILVAPGNGSSTNPISMYLSTNSGTSWTNTNVTNNTGFWQCGMSSTGQYMIATSYSGFSFISNDYGSNWSRTHMASTSWHIVCSISSSGQYMFIGNPNGTYFSSNYGSTWSVIPSVPGNGNFRYSAMSGTGQYIMSPLYGTAGLCYTCFGTYVNVPTTYTPVITNSVTNLAVSQYAPQQNPGALNINSSSAIVGTNFGTPGTWGTISQIPSGLTLATFMSSTGQYMIAGSQSNASGGLYWSTNYGASWAQYNIATFSTNVWWNGSAFSSNGQYMLVCGVSGTGAGVYLSSNFGQSFSLISNSLLPTANSFYGCSMSSNGQYMIAGTSVTFGLYLSTNYGVGWSLITGTNLPTNVGCLTPTMSSDGKYMLFAPFTTAGLVYVSSNFGVAWTAVPAVNGLPSSAIYWQTAMSSSGQYMIVGSGGNGTSSTGYAYLSTNFGLNWTTISVAVSTSIGSEYTCAISGTGEYMFLTNNSGCFYSNNYGSTWSNLSYLPSGGYRFASMSSNGQYIISAKSSATAYLSTGQITGNNTSALTTSTNYGLNSTWNAITNISSSAVKEGTAISSSGQYMYTGGSGIGLWWSQNFGVNWEQNANGVPTNGTIQQIGISSTGQYVLVASVGAGMYLSSNYGQNFTVILNAQLPTAHTWYAAAVSGTGQYMLAGVNNTGQQGSYISTNYGVTWNAISSTNIQTNISTLSMAISSNGQYMLTGGWSTTTPLYLSSNYGTTWSTIPASSGVTTTAVWYQVGMSSTGQYMIAGTSPYSNNAGVIFISSNYGVTWWSPQIGTSFSTNNNWNWNACCISGTGQYMFVQNAAGSFLSNDYGANWITITALPKTNSWRQPSISYTGQYILTQLYQGQLWLSSGTNTVGINNSTPQNALDIIGPMKYQTYMAYGYLTNSQTTTYGTGLAYTSATGYPATLSSNGGYYIPVTGVYNLTCTYGLSAAAVQNWEIAFVVGTTIPTGQNFSTLRTNTNAIAITVAESATVTFFNGVLRFTGRLTAGNYVWVIPANSNNAAITARNWGQTSGISPNMFNNFTGHLVST
jgi:hypothetical protein